MKVVLATHTFPPRFIGGIPKHVFYLARELTKFNDDVCVLTGDRCASMENLGGVNICRLRTLPLQISAGAIYRIIPMFLPELTKREPDIVHAHEYHHFTSDVSAFYAMAKNKPLVLTIHGFYLKTTMIKFLSKLYDKSLGSFTLATAEKLICVSKSLVEELLEKGASADKITYIPNGVCIKDILGPTRPNQFKEQYELSSSKIILAVGRLIETKGFQILIRAVPNILRRVPDAKVIIMGPDFGYKTKLKRLAAELNVEDAVLFTDVVSEKDLRNSYSAANVFVIPSLQESFPTTLLEAMCFRKPCVGSNVGGIPDIIENERSGLLVNAGDHNQLADGITKIIEDNSLANYIASNARKKAENYDWSHIASQIKRIYEEAARK